MTKTPEDRARAFDVVAYKLDQARKVAAHRYADSVDDCGIDKCEHDDWRQDCVLCAHLAGQRDGWRERGRDLRSTLDAARLALDRLMGDDSPGVRTSTEFTAMEMLNEAIRALDTEEKKT